MNNQHKPALKNKKPKKSKKSFWFLGLVILLYLFLSLNHLDLVKDSLEKTIKMFYRIIPLLGIVLIFMTLTNLYISSGKVKKHLGKESGWKGWLYASLAGVMISGPAYLLFPLLKELKKSGAKNSLLAVFLYNRNVKIPFLPILIFYFGLKYSLILTILIFFFAFLNGIIVGWLVRE